VGMGFHIDLLSYIRGAGGLRRLNIPIVKFWRR